MMDQVMVQIVENHAEIVGRLLGTAPAPERPGFVVLKVDVAEAHDVAAWPNFFKTEIGKTIDVLARADKDVARAALGPIRLKVRKGGPTTVFAE